MSDKIIGFHSFHIYDPDLAVGCTPHSDGSYAISLNHGDISLTGDLEVLLQIFAKAEALLEHEQIMRRKNADAWLEKARAQGE